MKVIDLLQRIANGEEVPEKFMVDGDTLYIGEDKFLEYANGERIEWFIYPSWLNEEIEIIEEDKKIENNFQYVYGCNNDMINANFENIRTTLENIIKAINEMREDKY